MADRPILFSAPMVRAMIREIEHPGTGKTQTRRILTPQPTAPFNSIFSDGAKWWTGDGLTGDAYESLSVKIQRGDRLWVREAWRNVCSGQSVDGYGDIRYGIGYRADGEVRWRPRTTAVYGAKNSGPLQFQPEPWRPSIHMAKRHSRITLIIENVRLERLQDISEADAIAEGHQTQQGWAPQYRGSDDLPWVSEWPRDAYADLWNSINGPGAWDANPWVAAYTFRPIIKNIDEVA